MEVSAAYRFHSSLAWRITTAPGASRTGLFAPHPSTPHQRGDDDVLRRHEGRRMTPLIIDQSLAAAKCRLGDGSHGSGARSLPSGLGLMTLKGYRRPREYRPRRPR
jgi:hypothetical protein